jgi:MFS family permease
LTANRKELVLLAASAISSFGSALTFTAIALILKESRGASSISYAFFVQTIPQIFLYPQFLTWAVGSRRKLSYQILLILLGVNVLTLCIHDSILWIYIYMAVSSVLVASSTPIASSLMGDWIGVARIAIFQTRAQSLRLIMWAVAPVICVFLFTTAGATAVFLLDAISFMVAAALISLLAAPEKKEAQTGEGSPQLGTSGQSVRDIVRGEHARFILVWYALTLASSVLNGVEFAIFDLSRLSEQEIGLALSAWGMGGALSFLATSWSFASRVSTSAILVMLSIVTLLFSCLRGLYVIYPAMFFMGAAFAVIGGRMRQEVECALTSPSNSLLLWGLIQQRTAFISLCTYLAIGLLLSNNWSIVVAVSILPLSVLCLLYLQISASLRTMRTIRGAPL